MTRDDEGADHGVPAWLTRSALVFVGILVGAAASVGLAAISWGLPFVTAPVAVGLLLFAITWATRARNRSWPWFLIGAAVGLGLGAAFLLWVLSAFAAAY